MVWIDRCFCPVAPFLRENEERINSDLSKNSVILHKHTLPSSLDDLIAFGDDSVNDPQVSSQSVDGGRDMRSCQHVVWVQCCYSTVVLLKRETDESIKL